MADKIKNTATSKKIIFVVEDDLFLIQAYQAKLKKENLEVWIATNGKEALSYLEKDPPNVVLLDLLLPGVSGFEFLSALRKNERWKNVPVLILSNLSQPENIETAKSLGAVEYIVKAETKINDVMERVKKYI
jgi:two-component system sensor histidine kinase/response regulator